MSHTLWNNVQANISLLFTEVPFERRPAAAADAGFTALECWWPFSGAAPPEREVERFAASVEDAGVRLRGLNFFGGDLAAGERGVVSHPRRRAELDDSIAVAASLGERLGTTVFNALYGNRITGADPSEQDDAALSALTAAAAAVRPLGAAVVLEPLSGVPAYPLKTAADALRVIDRAGIPNLALLADLYHLFVNGENVAAVIDAHIAAIGHVQLADSPGRHEPGTGEIDIFGLVDRLAANGYRGNLGLEYVPAGGTLDGLGWLPAASAR